MQIAELYKQPESYQHPRDSHYRNKILCKLLR